ncbi:MAG: 2-oxoacid:acceptor oxidoreductase subunit alpha [Chloroflexi bacterium]|nr:2-oxoacid:acceptor oxidoreductase subunit alpha [Chloroflexota bacterium]
MQKKDFVVRFAGEGGQGMVTSAEALAQAAALAGYYAQTFTTFPSQIMGGPTWAQARISTTPILSAGDELDILVCFNKEAYHLHAEEVREGGVVIYNSQVFQLEESSSAVGIPVDELAKATGNPRAANMVILGALAHLVSWPQEHLTSFVRQRFARGRPDDAAIIKSNVQALDLGRQRAAEAGLTLGELAPPKKPPYQQIMVKGNDALALGALAAGLDFYIGYPISPATPILVFMQRNLVGPGKFVYQASSEIEAINTIVGAGFAGKKAMTATSGPGFSLMHEGIGLAWMAEVPCVIVDVQRGGPATGLPTKTEQSDLLSALHPAHGDVMLPVIAPGSIEECFYAAIWALNWAERYQGPVVLLSEHMLSERTENIRKPDLSVVTVESRLVYQGSNGYHRYEARELSPMPVPGGPGAYVANGSEHDAMGDTTHLSQRHIHMTERRFSKLKLLTDGTFELENPEESVVLMPWGGSKGPSREAYTLLIQDGYRLGWAFTMFLQPLPPKLLEELRKKELVIVPELNYVGQFSSYLRSLGVKAVSITQFTGLPFKVLDLVRRVAAVAQSHRERMVRV